MKKQLLSVFSILFFFSASAQYEYSPTGRNDAPSLGKVMGFVGGGFTSMLNNRDDMSADQRLDPQMMNFSYAGGIEIMSWFQRTIGFGGQLMYWQGGAAYLGEDTITKMKLTAKTTMTYAKMPLMFYFKSYNRYYPNRRFRFNSSFGPYVAMLLSYNDYVKVYNDDWKVSRESTFSGTTFTGKATGAQDTKGKITSTLYNPFDLGFVFALGGEARLWRRTIISLNLRTDIGFSNVENTRKMKINYDSSNTDLDFAYWNSLYAKYNSPNALDVTKGWEANRPSTKNFSMGAFLTIKKYMSR
jgi:hypothetical protein